MLALNIILPATWLKNPGFILFPRSHEVPSRGARGWFFPLGFIHKKTRILSKASDTVRGRVSVVCRVLYSELMGVRRANPVSSFVPQKQK